LIGYLPLKVDIRGTAKTLALRLFDSLFKSETNENIARVNNHTIYLNLSNPSERLLFYMPYNLIKSYISSELCYVLKQISYRKKGVFVDIGANLGIYSLIAKELGFTTLLFEPEPKHYAFLSKNRDIFGKVYHYALTNFTGKQKFYVANERDSGASSLVMSSHGSEYQSIYDYSIDVDATTFDKVIEIEDLAVEDICLIKIDVEGNEYDTLSGMGKYLEREDSSIIWCEVRGPKSDRGENNYIEIIKYMTEFGYRPFIVVNEKIFPFVEKKGILQRVFDLLFLIPKNHLYYFKD